MKSSIKFLIMALVLTITSIVAIVVCDKIITKNAEAKIFNSVESIPYTKTGLLLGTSKYFRNNLINPYYQYRIEAAVQLFKNHKIKYLIISGDNSRKNYNEPELMKADLIKSGIDSTVLYLDYAGFRTFDSIVRAKEVFGQDSLTIISQKFHNERALYITQNQGLYAVAFNAKDISLKYGLKTQIRERFARVKVFLDILLGKDPKFLGSKITIPN